MLCSISGGVPEEPVFDKNTGHVFEKRLIFKYVKETGRSPVTGESLAEDDLVEIKNNQAVKPRPSPATSIPGLLSLFQNEWDALMLETHSLRQSLGTVRQELSQALYQHDASVRVIARLVRERDEARLALESAVAAVPEAANGKRSGAGDLEQPEAPAKRAKATGITADIVEVMTKQSAVLSKMRKKRQISETLATADEVAAMGLSGTLPLHKTSQGGILAVDFEPEKDHIVYTAGADHTGLVFDRNDNRVVSTLRGHSKKVTDIRTVGKQDLVITTSADKTARIWKGEGGGGGGFSCTAVLKDHSSDVTAATVHATNDFFITASLDKSWCFYDVSTATCLQQVTDDSITGGYTSAQLHPDGLILGAGTTDSLVRVWEVRQQKNVAKLAHTKGPVTSVSFSENGYYLATAAADSVKLWDLRKLLNFRDITLAAPPSFAAFDHSGLFLAVGGQDVEIYGIKQDWGVVKTFQDLPKKGVHAGKWGQDAKSLFVAAADHNLRIFETSAGGSAAAPME